MKYKLKLTVDSWISGFYDIAMKEREKTIMEELREKMTYEMKTR
jgi:hypothetical protein